MKKKRTLKRTHAETMTNAELKAWTKRQPWKVRNMIMDEMEKYYASGWIDGDEHRQQYESYHSTRTRQITARNRLGKL